MEMAASLDPRKDASGRCEFEAENGWVYWTCVEHEDEDVRKLEHFAVRGIRCKHLDWSPYHRLTPRQFHKLIRLDFPRRIGISPLDAEQLNSLYRAKTLGNSRPLLARGAEP